MVAAVNFLFPRKAPVRCLALRSNLPTCALAPPDPPPALALQLYKLKVGETVSTIPTIGFNVEKLQYKRCEMTTWDVGGQERLRRLWRHYYTGTDALIFVVDSADRERLSDAVEELTAVLSDPGMADCKSVLVYANKQDLPEALTPDEIASEMRMSEVAAGRKWWVQACVGVSNNGLYEGLDWLADRIMESG